MNRVGTVSGSENGSSKTRLVPMGVIVLAQIQRVKLNTETTDGMVYRTTPLVAVDSFQLCDSGVVARVNGDRLLDRHHRSHPAESVAHRPERVMSIGFSGHYRLIEERFGSAPLGVAGENVIVDLDERVSHDQVASGLVIRTSEGDLELDPPDVLNACVPFTKFLLQDPNASTSRVLAALEFLGAGMRGYSMGAGRVPDYRTVRTGDLVLRKVSE